MILNFDRGYGQSAEQMVQSLMESTQMAFDTLERKLGLPGDSLTDDDGNVITDKIEANNVITDKIEANNVITDKIEANNLAVKGELALGTALSIANGGTGATTAAAACSNLGIGNLMNYISAQLSSDFTLTNRYKQIPLAQVLKNGSLFEISGGGVKCLASGTIEVHATIYVVTGYTANDLINAHVYKNNTGIDYLRGNTRAVIASPYTILNINGFIEVAEGDVIMLYARNQSASRGVIGAGGVTKMDIKYIK